MPRENITTNVTDASTTTNPAETGIAPDSKDDTSGNNTADTSTDLTSPSNGEINTTTGEGNNSNINETNTTSGDGQNSTNQTNETLTIEKEIRLSNYTILEFTDDLYLIFTRNGTDKLPVTKTAVED